ncbi:hypothetical protein T265_01127 [Opisthorchis viverrini]|uniref:Uncharacterized protein n=1 Tax=Opisthorchis viverrini TaxID=6198 RepID=A0A075A3J5_OPIVI|nr:hypothetical protein T265_01127 [Opisthorchis viverrini]KER32837.1 hypothetical protein T265_01127 [Opisthorchis viverrini]
MLFLLIFHTENRATELEEGPTTYSPSVKKGSFSGQSSKPAAPDKTTDKQITVGFKTAQFPPTFFKEKQNNRLRLRFSDPKDIGQVLDKPQAQHLESNRVP